MKKRFFSHFQVCARIIKEPYDDQYQECLSILGNNEIQFQFETKLSSVSKNIVFQKRDKLVHSPEATKDSGKSEDIINESGESNSEEKSSSQKNLLDLIAKTERQVYKFDKVFPFKSSDYEIFQEMIEKPSSNALRKKSSLVLFNLVKSNTVLNLQLEDNMLEKKSWKNDIPKINLKTGILPVIINHLLESLTHGNGHSTPSKLFEKNMFNAIKMSAYVASGNKFYNLMSYDYKPYNSWKEINKIEVTDLSCLKPILQNLKSHILNKKLPVDFICYKIKIYDSELIKIKGMNSSIVLFDFFNPFEKSPDKIEKEEREHYKQENITENVNQALKIVYSLLANEKNTNLYKEKFFQNLSKVIKYNSKIYLIGNLRPIHPFYHQNLNIISLLNNIKESISKFDTLFNRMVYNQFKTIEAENDLKMTIFSPNSEKEKIQPENDLNVFELRENEALNIKISSLEDEKRKLAEDLTYKVKENKELSQIVSNLKEELNFVKNKSAQYIKDLNDAHQKEKQNFVEMLRQRENQIKTLMQKDSLEKKQVSLIDSNSNYHEHFSINQVDTFGDNKKKEEYSEELRILKKQVDTYSKQISNLENQNSDLRKDRSLKEKILAQMLAQFYSHTEKEQSNKNKLLEDVQNAFITKVTILENKNKFMETFNALLRQIIYSLIQKFHGVIKENEKVIDSKVQHVLVEMNQKFKEIKMKMLRKLNSKNEEIQKYANFFDDLEKRLGNLEKISPQ